MPRDPNASPQSALRAPSLLVNSDHLSNSISSSDLSLTESASQNHSPPLPRSSKISTPSLTRVQVSEGLTETIRYGMKAKKVHEVRLHYITRNLLNFQVTALLDPISELVSVSDVFIDVGAGKGYLSQVFALLISRSFYI